MRYVFQLAIREQWSKNIFIPQIYKLGVPVSALVPRKKLNWFSSLWKGAHKISTYYCTYTISLSLYSLPRNGKSREILTNYIKQWKKHSARYQLSSETKYSEKSSAITRQFTRRAGEKEEKIRYGMEKEKRDWGPQSKFMNALWTKPTSRF